MGVQPVVCCFTACDLVLPGAIKTCSGIDYRVPVRSGEPVIGVTLLGNCGVDDVGATVAIIKRQPNFRVTKFSKILRLGQINAQRVSRSSLLALITAGPVDVVLTCFFVPD